MLFIVGPQGDQKTLGQLIIALNEAIAPFDGSKAEPVNEEKAG